MRVRGARLWAAAPAVLAVLLLAACASPGIPRDAMRSLYEAAVRDAMDARPEEVRPDLLRLVPGEQGLEWSGGRVKLLAWSRERELRRRPGARFALAGELRVTAPEPVLDLCRGIDTGRKELQLRLEQFLGLPPGAGRGRRFVELWVAPADVFRPCLDPDPTRSGCGLDAPEGVPPEHFRWLEARAREAHRPGGEPWTGLGYLYDWGNPRSEVGPAEFVVRAGAEVEVAAVESTKDYCRRPRRGS